MAMHRNTVHRAKFLKSVWSYKSTRLVVHIHSKLSSPNARLCNICTASHAFLQLFSNYAWLCTHAQPVMDNPWPLIASLLVFPQPLQPSFLLKSQLLAHHRAFELSFLRFWIEVLEKSRTSLKQCNYECRRVGTVKLSDKKREEDKLK